MCETRGGESVDDGNTLYAMKWETDRRYLDAVRGDMVMFGVEEEDAEDRVTWWCKMIRCGHP